MLHPDSRHLTTFSTHVGLWCYKRLNFGMSCSAEIFQKRINDVIRGIPGVKNISDDIYIGGVDKEQHDVRLRSVLRRLQENNLTINAKKFQVNNMLFFGHVFSISGISPDPKKIEALQTVSPPKNVTEVRSLLSSASFSSRFIKDFATITRPLRKLTCKDQVWTWEAEQQNSFDQLKTALSKEVTLGYFDPGKNLSICRWKPHRPGRCIGSGGFKDKEYHSTVFCQLSSNSYRSPLSSDRSTLYILGY